MTEDQDPLATFFTASKAEDPDILYATLGVTRSATVDELRKAYRKAALKSHPDKHSHASAEAQANAAGEFQKIGFAWAVLSDEKRRKRYDSTGRTDEITFDEADGGWDAYFADLFEGVDRKVLDEDKKKYQGSEEEVGDIRTAYAETKGSLPSIMERIPHSAVADEARVVTIVNAEIAAGRLKSTRSWKSSSTDDKARKKRELAEGKEGKQAEDAAKELGVWDEFYGSGKKGARSGDKKSKTQDGEGALAALILNRQKSRQSNFASLEAKYAQPKGKKRKEEPHPAELDDAAFEALQAKMFKKDDKKRKTK